MDRLSSQDSQEFAGSSADGVWDDDILVKAYEQSVGSVNKALSQLKIKRNATTEPKRPEESQSVRHETSQNHDGLTSSILSSGLVTDSKKEDGTSKIRVVHTYSHSWEVGEPCVATWSDDGLEYEATVTSVDAIRNTCTVKFVGYDNEEVVDPSHLIPSRGESARAAQIAQWTLETKTRASKKATQSDKDTISSSQVTFDGSLNERITMAQIPIASQSYPSMSTLEASSTRSPRIPPPPGPAILDDMGATTQSDPVRREHEALQAMLTSWYLSGYHTGYYQAVRDLGKPHS